MMTAICILLIVAVVAVVVVAVLRRLPYCPLFAAFLNTSLCHRPSLTSPTLAPTALMAP